MTDLVVSSALMQLRRLVISDQPPAAAELSQQLRALQRRGLSKLDLVVHVERIRARNDASGEDERIEENALFALELIDGATRMGLSWDALQTAAAWVPLAVSQHTIDAGSRYAFSASDLLPSRQDLIDDELRQRLVSTCFQIVDGRRYEPTTADFFRAPKSGLTTRPAAVLAPQDRLIYEALVDAVAARSSKSLPSHVSWPRGRDTSGTYSDFAGAPQKWDVEFILRTDIANFYETIDHAYLSVTIGRRLALHGALPVAIEAFLDVIMRSSTGLPQGPPGSDVLASTYLLDIDVELARREWPIARYADDILVGASSFEEARARLRDLEALLRERGLSLATDKTRIMRRSTYLANLGAEDAPESLREKVEREVAEWVETNTDLTQADIIDALELPEQLQWDLLYHQSVSWGDALSGIDDQLLPPWIRAYERIYESEARRLENGGYPNAREALSVPELRRCLLFMSADARAIHLDHTHAVVDWHPTLVRDVSRYLTAVALVDPSAARRFIARRLHEQRDSDLEMAWLLAPAIEEPVLATLLRRELQDALGSAARPLTAATAFRALNEIHGMSADARKTSLESFSPALRAEVALSLTRALDTSGNDAIESLPTEGRLPADPLTS